MDALQDKGGDVLISGGFASQGKGGNLQMRSGFSEATTSGDLSLSTAASGVHGTSGMINIFSGSTTNGDSGHLSLQTGNALSPVESSFYAQKNSPTAKSGFIHMKVGTGTRGDGGNIELWSGSTYADTGSSMVPLDATGGNITMISGFSVHGNSGDLDFRSAKGGSSGSSGSILIENGHADFGPAGKMSILGGHSRVDKGSEVVIAAGVSGIEGDKVRDMNGQDVTIHAGATFASRSSGGRVMIYGGAGKSEDRYNGGNGGSIELVGGFALGKNVDDDVGGNIVLEGGDAANANGGMINMTSGYSRRTSSGDIILMTAFAGIKGVSGKGKNSLSLQLF